MKILSLILTCALAAGQAFAQREDSAAAVPLKNSLYFSIGVGSTQSANANQTLFKQMAYVAPGISFETAGGFGLSATSYFFAGDVTGNHFYEQDLTASYRYATNDYFSFGTGYSAYLYNKHSSVPQTPVKNDIFAWFSYDDFYLNPCVSFDYGFGSVTTPAKVLNGKRRTVVVGAQKISGHDITLLSNVSHDYDIYGILNQRDELTFTPGLALVTCTENYYQDRGTLQSLAARRLQSLESSAADQSAFKPRYTEASVTADYALGKFDIVTEYTVVLPLAGAGKKLYSYLSGSVLFKF